MQQVLRITGALSSAGVRTFSLTLANRRPVKVDAVAVFLRTVPTNAGAEPATEAELQQLEREIRVRIALDPQLNNLLTPQMVPVRAFQSKDVGPVPVEPFMVSGQDQTTVEWEADTNTFQKAAFTTGAGSSINLEVIFYGTDERTQ